MNKEFIPTWLYVKVHRDTGLKYLGKTIRDPNSYDGSGVYWKRHLAKYGKHVDTIWSHLYTDPDILKSEAEFFSKVYDIRTSSEWANLVEENGSTGGNLYDQTTEEHKLLMSVRTTGKKMPADHGKNVSKSKSGKKMSPLGLLAHEQMVRESLAGVPKTKNHRMKISTSLSGLQKSDDHKMNLSESIKKLEKIECSKCGKFCSPGNAKRWHFDNCRNK
jgi:hypothetical protein